MARPPARGRRGAKPEEEAPNLSSIVSVPVEEVSIRAVITRIEDVFSALGTDKLPDTVIPTGTRNNSGEAASFAVADKLLKLAEARKKAAFEVAEKAGVFGDKADWVEGDTVMVFNDPNFSINVKMGKPSTMIGREEVEAAAEKFLGKRASEFLEECKKPRAATKQIIVSMK